MTEELLEAWRTNHRINLTLIDAISDEGMACTLSKRGGRDVAPRPHQGRGVLDLGLGPEVETCVE